MILQNIRRNNLDAQPQPQPHHPRRIRLFRERNNELDRVTPIEFFQATRLYPHQYRQLHNILEPHLTPSIPTNHAIPSHIKLQSSLCYLSTGDNLRSSARGYGMSNASQSRHLNSTLNAIIAEVRLQIKTNPDPPVSTLLLLSLTQIHFCSYVIFT